MNPFSGNYQHQCGKVSYFLISEVRLHFYMFSSVRAASLKFLLILGRQIYHQHGGCVLNEAGVQLVLARVQNASFVSQLEGAARA